MAKKQEEKRVPGDVIRDARKAKGWTQAELAERLGVGQGNVSDLENDRPNGRRSLEWFIQHAEAWEALGVDVTELAGMVSPAPKGACPCCGRPY